MMLRYMDILHIVSRSTAYTAKHGHEANIQRQEKYGVQHLLIALTICILLLSACGSHAKPSTSASSSTAHSPGSITTISTLNSCQGLRDQQMRLSQQYHAASIQSSAVRNHGGTQQIDATVQRLTRLRLSITQGQVQLRLCNKNAS
jgi:hypothetical protein